MVWALVPLPREYVCEATNFAPKPMNPPPAGTGTSVHGRAVLRMAWRVGVNRIVRCTYAGPKLDNRHPAAAG